MRYGINKCFGRRDINNVMNRLNGEWYRNTSTTKNRIGRGQQAYTHVIRTRMSNFLLKLYFLESFGFEPRSSAKSNLFDVLIYHQVKQEQSNEFVL